MDIDDVHDAAFVLGELRRRLLRNEERRAQIRADELFPVRRFNLAHLHRKEADALFTRMSSRPKPSSAARSSARRDRREKLGFDLGCALRPRGVEFGLEAGRIGFRVAIMDQHFRARRVQTPRDRRADARAPPVTSAALPSSESFMNREILG